MTARFQNLSERDLQEIALAIRSGRLSRPFATVTLKRIVAGDCADSAAVDLQWLSENGFGPEQVAVALDLLRMERRERPLIEDVIELVTTGPDVSGISNRDTSVVVRELFAAATESVLASGYAIHQGRRVFQTLADRMLEIPQLKVRLFLDIQRGQGDTTIERDLIRRFSERFRSHQWPKDRPLPDLFFDPRSLETDTDRRACLHAKCVVIDNERVFISSANFTQAAQRRNLEVGLQIRSRDVADRIVRYFNGLVEKKLLTPIT